MDVMESFVFATGDLTVGTGCAVIGNTTIEAANVVVENGASINADGLGYPRDEGPGLGIAGSGGSHGGHGGDSETAVYGSAVAPADFGSGGATVPGLGAGAEGRKGSAGGGKLRIDLSDSLTVDGTILFLRSPSEVEKTYLAATSTPISMMSPKVLLSPSTKQAPKLWVSISIARVHGRISARQ